MRLILACLFSLVCFLGAPSVANAQAGFMLGMVLGAGIAGNNDSVGNSGGMNLLYVMPRATERISDPLGMRQTSTECLYYNGSNNGRTIREAFAATIQDSEQYEMLQVVRTSAADSTGCLRYWITFIEKDKVIPLELLPPVETDP